MATSSARRERRRSPGEGSVYKVDGRWRAALSWTEADGTRRRRVVSGRTQAEARDRLDTLRRELALGAPMPAKGRALTVGEYISEWIARNRARVRPATWLVREQHVRLWLVPALGRIALARLSPADVERALAAFLQDGRPHPEAGPEGRGRRRSVSPLTVRHVRATLRMALSDAERDGLVSRNAAGRARPPRVPYAPIAYLTAMQVRQLLDATRDAEHGPLYALLVGSGLRLGEALGLAWGDVDQEAGALRVRRSMALQADGSYAVGAPKTAKSRRTIPVTAVAREALRLQRVRQAAQRLAAGTAWQDREGLVFTDAVGHGLRPRDISYAFARDVRAAGLPKVRLHWLRHTYATLALGQGVGLATVAELLGHSGVSITALHYAAVVPELKRDAAAAIDRALAGAG